MSRYIDAELAEAAMTKLYEEDVEMYAVEIPETFDKGRAISELRKIPAADVEKVRHGEWIPIKQKKYWADTEAISSNMVGFYCSECGTEEKFKYRYCHCGARMDGRRKPMSVLIDMEMPKNCGECPLAEATAELYCNSYVLSQENRPDWCPLREVPDIGAIGRRK